jgi:DNA-binding winged helix-turn-helix (wHTH) protein/Tol biopolymer transport system component
MLAAETEPVRPVSSTVAFGGFTFDRSNGLLREGDREIPLPPRAVAVLDLLVSRAGAIVPRQELIETVWKEAFVTDTSLAEAISVLRQALGDDSQSPTYIQTVHRRGYRFVAAITAPAVTESERYVSIQQTSPPTPTSPSIPWQLTPWTVALLSLGLAISAVWQYTHRRQPFSPMVRMRIEAAPGTTFDRRAPALALSADGSVIAWSACSNDCRLYVRRLDQLEPRAIPGTDDASAPFFSPDGRWLGFFANGKLRKVALAGGTPTVVAEAPQPFGAVWMADGTIVFAASERGGLLRISDRGGAAQQLTIPSAPAGEVRHAWPTLAPGGRALLFSIATSPVAGASGHIALMSLDSPAAWQTIVDDADISQAAAEDYIAFSRGNEIHALAFDRARQTIAGADGLVVSGVGRTEFAVSRSGALVYANASGGGRPALDWIPAAPPSSPDLAALQSLTLSIDASRIAGVGGSDIWTGDIARGTLTRLTHSGVNVSPVWAPDGRAVYYAASDGGAFETWMRDSSGTLPARRVLSAADRHHHVFPTSVSGDGTLIAYTESGGVARGDVSVAAIGSGAIVGVVNTPFDESNGVLSPDGRLLAYQSDESGRWEVSVLNLAERRRLPVSTAGGTNPVWSHDGTSLAYRTGDVLMRAAVDPSGETHGSPFRIAALSGSDLVGVSVDNRLLVRSSGDLPLTQAVLTLEWVRELRTVLGPAIAALPR